MAVTLSIIMIGAILVTYFGAKERTKVDRSKKDKPGILESMAVTFKKRYCQELWMTGLLSRGDLLDAVHESYSSNHIRQQRTAV